jgi:hypothetical protein
MEWLRYTFHPHNFADAYAPPNPHFFVTSRLQFVIGIIEHRLLATGSIATTLPQLQEPDLRKLEHRLSHQIIQAFLLVFCIPLVF